MSANDSSSTAHTKSASTFRLTLLDAVKLAAMIMMMQGHTLDAVVRPSEMDLLHFPWVIWYHIRGFTAPIFLTVSGMLFALTLKRQSNGMMQFSQAWKRVRWSMVLAFFGYLLAFPASNIFHLQFVHSQGWMWFFQVNILQLNAVALTMITATALATRSDRQFGWTTAVLSFILCFAAPWVNNVSWYSIVPEAFGGFLSYAHGSYFPLFPFASYMFFGAALGSRMRAVPRDQQQAFLTRMSLWVGLSLLVLGTLLLYVDTTIIHMPQLDVLQSMPSTVLLRSAVVLLSIVAIAQARGFMQRHRKLIELFGKQSLVIYIVHIVILFGSPWFSSFGRAYYKSMALSAGAMLAVVVVISTLYVVYAENLIQWRHPKVHKALQFFLLLSLIYCLLV